jgi:hypothetical protein
MGDEIQKFTKLTFILHFVVGLLFTILFWIPDITVPLYVGSITLETHAMSLTIGSLFAGLTVSSLLGILAKEWKEVRIIVILEFVWLVGNLVTTIIGFAVFNTLMAVLTIVITIIFILLFLLTFLQQEDKMKSLF